MANEIQKEAAGDLAAFNKARGIAGPRGIGPDPASMETQNAPVTGALSGGPPPDTAPVTGLTGQVMQPIQTPHESASQRIAKFVGGGQATPGSVWRGILGGALQGMTAGAGQGHFGSGVAAGAQAQQVQQQRQFENQLQASKEESERQLRAASIAKTNHDIWESTQKLSMQQAEARAGHAQSLINFQKEAMAMSADTKSLGHFQNLDDNEIARLRADHPEFAKDLSKGTIFAVPHFSEEMKDGKATGNQIYDGVDAFYIPSDALNKKLDHDITYQKFVPGKTATEPGHFEDDIIHAKSMTQHDAMQLWQKQQELAAKYDSDSAIAKANAEVTRAQAALAKSQKSAVDAQLLQDHAKQQGRNVVEANLDPSQIPRRGKEWDAIQAEANAYSQQKYGHDFDWAKADSDFKDAQKNRDTLNYMNSLTGANGQGGNFAQLQRLSNSITRTDYPAINDAKAWARIQTGDPAITNFKGLAIEVSDQVAKILQGGGTGSGTTDAKLKQAAELFNTGFNKQQLSGMIATLREALNNRKMGMIGNNRYLMKWYGPNSAIVQGTGGGANTPQTAQNPAGLNL